MTNVLDNVLNSVGYGISVRLDCPFCGGNNTFSVTNSGSQVKYHCFRNSCNGKSTGIKSVSMDKADIARILKERHLTEAKTPFRLPSYVQRGLASKNAFKLILDTNGLPSYKREAYSVAYDPIENRLLYLLIENKEVVGAVGRSLGGELPKSKIYPNSKIMPFIVGCTDKAIIVEDCASAAAVNSFNPELTGMALLGTILKSEYYKYLDSFKTLTIVLDYDARKKALGIRNLVKYMNETVKIIVSKKDIKDMTIDEWNEFYV